MLDLLTYWYEILDSTLAPLWLKGVALVLLVVPSMLTLFAAAMMGALVRYRHRRKSFAVRRGWRWRGGRVYSGRIQGDVPWEGGCYESDDAGRYMNWDTGPLRVDNRHRLMLISRAEYETTIKRVYEVVRQEQAYSLPLNENSLATAGLGVALVGAAMMLDFSLLRPDCREESWARDPQMRVWPVGSAAFQRQYAVVSNDRELAGRIISPRLEQTLLALPVSQSGQFKAYLRSNRLTLDAAPGFIDDGDLERFVQVGIMMADDAIA